MDRALSSTERLRRVSAAVRRSLLEDLEKTSGAFGEALHLARRKAGTGGSDEGPTRLPAAGRQPQSQVTFGLAVSHLRRMTVRSRHLLVAIAGHLEQRGDLHPEDRAGLKRVRAMHFLLAAGQRAGSLPDLDGVEGVGPALQRQMTMLLEACEQKGHEVAAPERIHERTSA